MIRTQVQLSEQQARALKEVASARGVSIAEVIRQALDKHLGDQATESRRQRAVQAVGGYRSGRHDVSESHDSHVADAFAE
jgi:Arc/MetJ-type ribon-helix-helix transcriptional regulator